MEKVLKLWQKTKSIRLAYEICEELCKIMEIKNGRD